MYSKMELPSAKTVISTAASVAATAMLVRSFARDFVPHEVRQYFSEKFHYFLAAFSNEIILTIDEVDGLNRNELFYAAELYLGTIGKHSARLFRASLAEKEKKIHVSIGGNEEVTDNFCGIRVKWRMVVRQTQSRYVPYHDDFNSTVKTDVRYMELIFHKKHNSRVLDEYLPYVVERSRAVKEGKKTLKLHTLKNDRIHGPRISPWQSVNLDHPATFETLAMDSQMKEMIVDDLDRFVKRRDFYRKVGKAWKRGYLLYGPPGTGKSSLIAAMANYLNFDVYDLELTDLRCNSDLRKLLISTANRSILVVEDIDASIDLSERTAAAPKPRYPPGYPHHDQGPKVTLSGLLNFVDGLWSSCGDERIIVFTTNHKEKLDPALLRPGRMDVHIHMSYCTPCGFKMLLKNYIVIPDSPLVSKAEGMISLINVTPAEVGEQLLKSDDPEIALQGLIKFLERKKEEKLEVTVREVVTMAEETEGIQDKNMNNGLDGLKELIAIGNGSPAEMTDKLVKKDEAAKALKTLLRFLGEETGAQDGDGDGNGQVGSSIATLAKPVQENGTKIE